MKCEYCEIIKSEILYEDEEVVIAIKDTALAPGQLLVFPKKHYTILEMVPDQLLRKCSILSNKVSMALFDSLGCQGTNVLVQNGVSAGQQVPHFALEIIPRRENDGLNLQWKPKQLMEEEMAPVFSLLKEACAEIYVDESKPQPKKETVVLKDKDTEIMVAKEGKNNYLLKSIRRVP